MSILIGFITIGIFSALPYPYSEFPIIPILFTLALIFRVRPASFWFLFVVIFMLDLYRGAGFGVGILSFVFLVFVSDKIARDVFSHRSMIGCVVISAATSMFWVVFNLLFSQIAWWLHGVPHNISMGSFAVSLLLQCGISIAIVGTLYSLAPRWLRDHSPMIIGGRI